MLIIKINTNSALMEAWLSSAGGREQDLLPAEPPQLVREVCGQVEPPCPSLDATESPSRKAVAGRAAGRTDSKRDLMPWGVWESRIPPSPGPSLQPRSLC